ncbi:MAG: DEAD/DEAH box helicase [Methanosarcinales archaeon]|nr:DEAD/DEAH box helicase [Methanosarcinales archaeon]
MTISDIIQNIKSSESYKNQIVHIEDIPLKEPEYGSIEIKPLVNFALDQVGIKQLYTHQVEAIKQIRNGKDIVLVTSTASGKSIAYMIPIFESVRRLVAGKEERVTSLSTATNPKRNVCYPSRPTFRVGCKK